MKQGNKSMKRTGSALSIASKRHSQKIEKENNY
jgi:hypothetical protein